MNVNSFRVDIRPTSKTGAVKAYADVQLIFEGGTISIFGLSIIEKDGKAPWVAFPSRPGNVQGKYFPVVEADGEVKKTISRLVLDKYDETNPD